MNLKELGMRKEEGNDEYDDNAPNSLMVRFGYCVNLIRVHLRSQKKKHPLSRR